MQFKNGQKIFHLEDIQVANKDMKRYSIPYIIRELKTKTPMRTYYILSEWPNNPETALNVGEDMEQQGLSLTVEI